MGMKRPWKVHFHHDGTKVFPDSENHPGAYIIDTTKPIDGTSSHGDKGSADSAAQRISRAGGRAAIIYRDPNTGASTTIREYQPYEAAMDDLANT